MDCELIRYADIVRFDKPVAALINKPCEPAPGRPYNEGLRVSIDWNLGSLVEVCPHVRREFGRGQERGLSLRLWHTENVPANALFDPLRFMGLTIRHHHNG